MESRIFRNCNVLFNSVPIGMPQSKWSQTHAPWEVPHMILKILSCYRTFSDPSFSAIPLLLGLCTNSLTISDISYSCCHHGYQLPNLIDYFIRQTYLNCLWALFDSELSWKPESWHSWLSVTVKVSKELLWTSGFLEMSTAHEWRGQDVAWAHSDLLTHHECLHHHPLVCSKLPFHWEVPNMFLLQQQTLAFKSQSTSR